MTEKPITLPLIVFQQNVIVPDDGIQEFTADEKTAEKIRLMLQNGQSRAAGVYLKNPEAGKTNLENFTEYGVIFDVLDLPDSNQKIKIQTISCCKILKNESGENCLVQTEELPDGIIRKDTENHIRLQVNLYPQAFGIDQDGFKEAVSLFESGEPGVLKVFKFLRDYIKADYRKLVHFLGLSSLREAVEMAAAATDQAVEDYINRFNYKRPREITYSDSSPNSLRENEEFCESCRTSGETDQLENFMRVIQSITESIDKEKGKNYIQYLQHLPWKKEHAEIDLDQVKTVLNSKLNQADTSKREIFNYFKALKAYGGKSKTIGSMLLLEKSDSRSGEQIASVIAESLDRKFNSLKDKDWSEDASIQGEAAGRWKAGKPGYILDAVKTAGVSNPVIYIGEFTPNNTLNGYAFSIDKLEEILNPDTNVRYQDQYLGIPYDLSNVLFIASCMNVQNMEFLSQAVLDLSMIIEIEPVGFAETKELIEKNILLPLMKEYEISSSELQIDVSAMRILFELAGPVGIEAYKKYIVKILKKAKIKLADENSGKLDINAGNLNQYLGNQVIENRKKDYRQSIRDAEMPPVAEAAALKAADQLNKIISSQDRTNIDNKEFVDWLLKLPWKTQMQEIDLKKAQKTLDAGHYGMEAAKRCILEHLAVMKRNQKKQGSFIILQGSPGIGKTSLAKSIAEALGRKCSRISLGGVYDEGSLRGFERTYIKSRPGSIIQAMAETGVKNPVIILDEIDKTAKFSNHGDVNAALLEIVDPEQNSSFRDHYLQLPYDLSDVFFIGTSNDLLNIPEPLRDRAEIIELDPYTLDEKLHIAKDYLVPKIKKETFFTEETLVFEDDAVEKIIQDYTAEDGVRELTQKIRNIARKVSADFELNDLGAVHVTVEDLPKYLGGKTTLLKSSNYRKRIAVSDMPEDIKTEAYREAEKLNLGENTTSSQDVKRYLDLLCRLPWKTETQAQDIDINEVRKILDEGHYGMELVKKRILEYFAKLKLCGKKQGTVLILNGHSGVGKTSIAESIAKAFGRKSARISLGGVQDEHFLRGHDRSYTGSRPGSIIQAVAQTGVKNPVIILDEIDKVRDIGISAALLEILDPEQNSTFMDHYLGVPYDLSDVFFIGTSNEYQEIPLPLLNRAEIIHLGAYNSEEKFYIAKEHLIPKVIKQSGLKPDQLSFTDAAIERLISNYTFEAGVRELTQRIEEIAQKTALKIVMNELNSIVVDENELEKFQIEAHVPSIKPVPKKAVPGVVNGMGAYAFGQGGVILPVEVSLLPGSGDIKLTGNLAAIIQESAQTAVSFVRSMIPVEEFDFAKHDIHIHLPGGNSKDGPSAGCTFVTAVVSELFGIPADPKTAMTGEISLKGNVLPVGGIGAKITGTYRAGVRRFFIPEANREEIQEIPEDIRNDIQIECVEKVDEILDKLLHVKLRTPEYLTQNFRELILDDDNQED